MDEFPGAADTVALDRGEMGGKRRKAPHERAGWKEILEEEERAKVEAAAQASHQVQQQQAAGDDAQKEDEYGAKMKRAKLRWVAQQLCLWSYQLNFAARRAVPSRIARRSRCSAASARRR